MDQGIKIIKSELTIDLTNVTPRKFGTDLTQSAIGNKQHSNHAPLSKGQTKKSMIERKRRKSTAKKRKPLSQTPYDNIQQYHNDKRLSTFAIGDVVTPKNFDSNRSDTIARNLESEGSLKRAENGVQSRSAVLPTSSLSSSPKLLNRPDVDIEILMKKCGDNATSPLSNLSNITQSLPSLSHMKIGSKIKTVHFNGGPIGMKLEPVMKSGDKEYGSRVVSFVELGDNPSQARLSKRVHVGDILVAVDGREIVSKPYQTILRLLRDIASQEEKTISFRSVAQSPESRVSSSVTASDDSIRHIATPRAAPSLQCINRSTTKSKCDVLKERSISLINNPNQWSIEEKQHIPQSLILSPSFVKRMSASKGMKGTSLNSSPKLQQEENTSISNVLNTVMRNIAPSITASHNTNQNATSNIGDNTTIIDSLSKALIGSSSTQFDKTVQMKMELLTELSHAKAAIGEHEKKVIDLEKTVIRLSKENELVQNEKARAEMDLHEIRIGKVPDLKNVSCKHVRMAGDTTNSDTNQNILLKTQHGEITRFTYQELEAKNKEKIKLQNDVSHLSQLLKESKKSKKILMEKVTLIKRQFQEEKILNKKCNITIKELEQKFTGTKRVIDSMCSQAGRVRLKGSLSKELTSLHDQARMLDQSSEMDTADKSKQMERLQAQILANNYTLNLLNCYSNRITFHADKSSQSQKLKFINSNQNYYDIDSDLPWLKGEKEEENSTLQTETESLIQAGSWNTNNMDEYYIKAIEVLQEGMLSLLKDEGEESIDKRLDIKDIFQEVEKKSQEDEKKRICDHNDIKPDKKMVCTREKLWEGRTVFESTVIPNADYCNKQDNLISQIKEQAIINCAAKNESMSKGDTFERVNCEIEEDMNVIDSMNKACIKASAEKSDLITQINVQQNTFKRLVNKSNEQKLLLDQTTTNFTSTKNQVDDLQREIQCVKIAKQIEVESLTSLFASMDQAICKQQELSREQTNFIKVTIARIRSVINKKETDTKIVQKKLKGKDALCNEQEKNDVLDEKSDFITESNITTGTLSSTENQVEVVQNRIEWLKESKQVDVDLLASQIVSMEQALFRQQEISRQQKADVDVIIGRLVNIISENDTKRKNLWQGLQQRDTLFGAIQRKYVVKMSAICDYFQFHLLNFYQLLEKGVFKINVLNDHQNAKKLISTEENQLAEKGDTVLYELERNNINNGKVEYMKVEQNSALFWYWGRGAVWGLDICPKSASFCLKNKGYWDGTFRTVMITRLLEE